MADHGPDRTLANASVYLRLFGHVTVAWMWLRQANAAAQCLNGAHSETDANFYQGKMQAARYFFAWELPTVARDIALLEALDDTCFNMRDEWF
jgi:hypothetical protein